MTKSRISLSAIPTVLGLAVVTIFFDHMPLAGVILIALASLGLTALSLTFAGYFQSRAMRREENESPGRASKMRPKTQLWVGVVMTLFFIIQGLLDLSNPYPPVALHRVVGAMMLVGWPAGVYVAWRGYRLMKGKG